MCSPSLADPHATDGKMPLVAPVYIPPVCSWVKHNNTKQTPLVPNRGRCPLLPGEAACPVIDEISPARNFPPLLRKSDTPALQTFLLSGLCLVTTRNRPCFATGNYACETFHKVIYSPFVRQQESEAGYWLSKFRPRWGVIPRSRRPGGRRLCNPGGFGLAPRMPGG
jgi:hypothetical protein